MNNFSYITDSLLYPTDNLVFVTAIPASKDHHLPFEAGQYVKVKLQDNATLLLSIANAPREDGKLFFHLRRHQDHPLPKQWLLEGPYGNNTLNQLCTKKNLVLLAGGTGFAPIRSLLETMIKENRPDLSITLFWGIQRPEDVYDLDFLNALRSLLSNFQYHLVLSNLTDFPQWHGSLGWVHEHCGNIIPQWEKTTVYASGPFEMVQAAYRAFTERGLIQSDFRSDMEIA